MKKLSITLLAVLTATLTFGQMKNQPEVVVVFLGPINSSLDAAEFPDLDFYSTPDLNLVTSKKASENTNKKAWSSALGIGRTSGDEEIDRYTGNPKEIVDKNIISGTAFLFDKEGLINAKIHHGESAEFNKGTDFLVKFNKMKRQWEQESFDNLMKTLTKKGTAVKPDKKSKKKEEGKYEIGETIDDFKVSDKNGEAKGMHSLVKGNTATLVLFLRVNPEYDLKEGKESGAGKKGKDYANQVAQSIAAEKQMAPLYRLEKGIFGKK